MVILGHAGLANVRKVERNINKENLGQVGALLFDLQVIFLTFDIIAYK